jgi:hypothetical protein
MLSAGPAAAAPFAPQLEVNVNVEFCDSKEAEFAMVIGHNPLTSGHRSIYCQRKCRNFWSAQAPSRASKEESVVGFAY